MEFKYCKKKTRMQDKERRDIMETKIKVFCIIACVLLISTFLNAQSMTYFQYYGDSTWATDIDNENIIGMSINSTYTSVVGFKTTNNGASFQTLMYPGENFTYPQGIDGDNIVGYFKDSGAVSHGFMYDGITWTQLDHTSGYQTEMLGVYGDSYIGYYYDGTNYHGCLYDSGTDTWTTIDRPSYANTKFTSIYGNVIIGNSGNNYSNVNTGFMYNISNDTWTSIDYGVDGDPNSPQMTWYQSTNIEDVNATHILAYYETSGAVKINFIYEISSGSYSLLAYDQTNSEQACGMNSIEDFVGYREGGGVYAYRWQQIDPPTVTTQAVSGIDATTATGNGNITNLGEENPSEHGVCWNTTGTPTTDDNHTTEGSVTSTGSFSSSITGLTEGETYYVRAYATNSGGTSYGNEVSFTAVASVSQTWTIELTDSFGDGWNGGSINLLVNSSVVLSNLTLNTGYGPQIFEFSVTCSDVITTQYFAGGYSYENEYQIKDHNGTVVAQSGQYESTPQDISYTVTCPGTPGTVTTQAVSNIGVTTATGNGNITSIGTTAITAHGVCWNISGNPTILDSSTDEGATISTGTFTSNVTGLESGQTYYLKAYIIDDTGTIYGDQVSFTTESLVTTQAVTEITGTTATGNGTILSLDSPISAHGVCWNTTGSPTVFDSSNDEGSAVSLGAFTSDISGLSSSTTYYVRAYITNTTGTYYGNQISFTTSFVSLFSGSGTIGDPYIISDLTDLRNFSENSGYWDKHFIQTSDIDASESSTWNGGEGLSAISFSGSYNGQGHVISGLFIDKAIYGRAFFTSTNGASISNLGLVDVDFTCWGNVGAFIGTSSGSTSITSCYSTGTVNGSYTNAGGFVGYAGSGTLTITNCYNRVSTFGDSFSGGFVGRAQATINISNSYNSGSITGNDYTGGLMAYNYYSSDSITDSFWDTETSGQSSSYNGGIGKSNAEMKQISTFTDANWDFSSPIWEIDSNKNDGYPYLEWQTFAEKPSAATNIFPEDSSTDRPRTVTVNWRYRGLELPTHFKIYQGNTLVNIIEYTSDILYHQRLNIAEWGEIVNWKVIPYNDSGDCESPVEWSFTVMPEPSNTAQEPAEVVYAEVIEYSGTTPPQISFPLIDLGDGNVIPTVDLSFDSEVSALSVPLQVQDQPDVPLPNPSNCGAALRLTLPNGNLTRIVFNFLGSFTPTELVHLNGAVWEVVPIAPNNVVFSQGQVEFDWVSNDRGEEEFAVNGGGGSTLPVELSSFTAVSTADNSAKINWVTQSETDLIGFNIFRNMDNLVSNSHRVNNSIISSTNTSTEQQYNFIDEEVELEHEYYYWLESVDIDGSSLLYGPITVTITDIEQPGDTPDISYLTEINSIYPNPFNPSTTISFSLKSEQNVRISVYNMKGQLIKILCDGVKAEGRHLETWNGKDSDNKMASSGVYIFKMITNNKIITEKSVMLK